MPKLVKRFLKDQSGATAIEYGLIAALISVAVVAGASGSGQLIADNFNTAADAMTSNN